jgi:FtsP/CotA-like multicopper oxidase with cupredoxin domain
VFSLEGGSCKLTNIREANPDGQYERPTIGINGQWPLPVMTATINDTVVVNVINQLGKTLLPSSPFHLKLLWLTDWSQAIKQPLFISTEFTKMEPRRWMGQLKSLNVGLLLDLSSPTILQ